jgi:hypothetical protein
MSDVMIHVDRYRRSVRNFRWYVGYLVRKISPRRLADSQVRIGGVYMDGGVKVRVVSRWDHADIHGSGVIKYSWSPRAMRKGWTVQCVNDPLPNGGFYGVHSYQFTRTRNGVEEVS